MAVMPFATGTTDRPSLAVQTQALENVYPEISRDGKSVVALYTRPGLKSLYDFGENPIRGMYLTGDSSRGFDLYVAVYNSVLRVTKVNLRASGPIAQTTPEYIGALVTTEGPVYIASNGGQVLFTDSLNGYVYDEGALTFVQLDFPTHGWNLQQPQFCTYLATYLVVMDKEDGSYYISDNNNALLWNAADKAFAESDPDGLMCIVADHGELALFGTRTTEFHYNSGASDFPFEPKLSATIEWGTPAPLSVAKFDNTLAFLGQSTRGGLRVFRLNGYQPVRISDDAMERRLDEMTVITDAVAYGFDFGGHAFYQITFPTEGQSWLYDEATKQWARTSSAGGRFIGEYAIGRESGTLVSDYRAGQLYTIAETQTDGEIPIHIQARAQTINDGERYLPFKSLQIVCEHGTAPQSVSPQAMMRWSNDNGFTWSSRYWRSMGRVGEYEARCRWNRLGKVRNRTFEIQITDPVPRVVVGMVLNSA